MDHITRLHRSSFDPSAPALVPAMVFDLEGAALDQPAAFGTRVITQHQAGTPLADIMQAKVASGWWVQGVRKIGDRLFVERVAL